MRAANLLLIGGCFVACAASADPATSEPAESPRQEQIEQHPPSRSRAMPADLKEAFRLLAMEQSAQNAHCRCQTDTPCYPLENFKND